MDRLKRRRAPGARAIAMAMVTAIAVVIGSAAAAVFALVALGYHVDLRLQLAIALPGVGLAVTAWLLARRVRPGSVRSAPDVAGLRRRLEAVERLAIAGELAAKVAHEIKNPLAPIKGYAQMLEARLSSVAEEDRALFAKGLRIIRLEADGIDARIRSLLKASRPTAEDILDRSFDANQVITEAIAVLEGTPGAPRVVAELLDDLPRACGDADEMRSALLNVIRNAIEAMAGAPRDAVVRVVTGLVDVAGEPRILVEIEDQGVGLGTVEQEVLFRTFYTTKKDGTGLGLAIARTAVESAGGDIQISSREDVQGAVVSIRLPPARS